MERDGNGSRFAFYQEDIHGDYLLWLHHNLSSLGYCKPDIPQPHGRGAVRKGLNGSTRKIYRFRTYTFSSFNWIYDEFYPYKRKIIPKFIDEYLSPSALAIWIMDDGTLYKNKGLKFCTNSYTLNEVQYLGKILENKYSLKFSIHKTGVVNQYGLYIHKSSMSTLTEIVKPFLHPSMLYKLPKLSD